LRETLTTKDFLTSAPTPGMAEETTQRT